MEEIISLKNINLEEENELFIHTEGDKTFKYI